MSTPNPKNNQKVFDFIIKKLAEQGRPAMNDKGVCRYRATDGCRCAVGWLIPNEEYDPEWEDTSVGFSVSGAPNDTGPSQWLNDKGYDLDLLEEMQAVHDSAARFAVEGKGAALQVWSKGFKAIAEDYELSPAYVDSLMK